MSVKELIEQLSTMPSDAQAVINTGEGELPEGIYSITLVGPTNFGSAVKGCEIFPLDRAKYE